ncbi:Alpha crystallin/Hsp20 domain [Dillenia turbinata]|uniref:Alpha crystallin/Hsp20 domain n=1 Tax=Dillenia turbinata TaxID=194707 RepID=A0AAN8ZBY6_9MAGN
MSLIPSFSGGRRLNVFDPFPLDVWDPFEGSPFYDDFRSLFDQIRSSLLFDTAGARIDWKETPTAYVFKADIPGLKKEEVKVEVEDGVLTVTVPKVEERKRDVRTIEISG